MGACGWAGRSSWWPSPPRPRPPTPPAPGITREYLNSTWQLLDLDVPADDPVGSIRYLHTQPRLQRRGGGDRLAAAPIAGTLFALDVAALAGAGLLLQRILVRSGVGPLTAGGVASVAVLSPSLVNTIGLASYEVLVCLLVVAAIAAAQRYLDGPRTFWLVAASALLTAAALTRSLLHPVWVLAVLALLMTAADRRWRQAGGAGRARPADQGVDAQEPGRVRHRHDLELAGFNLQREVVNLAPTWCSPTCSRAVANLATYGAVGGPPRPPPVSRARAGRTTTPLT